MACLVSVLVVPINLCGIDLITYPFRLIHSIWGEHLNEWQPLWADFGLHWIYLSFLAITLCNTALFHRHFEPYELLIYWGFGLLSLTGSATHSAVSFLRCLSGPRRYRTRALRTQVAQPCHVVLYRHGQCRLHGVASGRSRHPASERRSGLVSPLRLRLSGGQARCLAHLFTPYGLGGYVIWRLAPRYQGFIHGRAVELYPGSVYADYLAAAFQPAR